MKETKIPVSAIVAGGAAIIGGFLTIANGKRKAEKKEELALRIGKKKEKKED